MIKTLSEIADAVQIAINKIPNSIERGRCIEIGADGTETSQIDKVAENTVLDYIQRNNIRLNVLSEEIGLVDNGFEDTLVLDPIDGTSNAIAGIPLFTISMAIGRDSMSNTHTAYLRNLVTNDVMTAERGRGAFKNGKRMKVRKDPDMDDLFLMLYMGNGANRSTFKLAKRIRSSRALGCASLEMELVAEGEADGFVMNSERYGKSIRIVDIAASALILREAGGEIYDMDGKVLDMRYNLEERSSFIAVGDRKVYDFIMDSERGMPVNPKIGMKVNLGISGAKEYADKALKALVGADVTFDEESASAFNARGLPIGDMDVDVMLTIGGDGTILRTLMETSKPLVGINAGGVGFLAEIGPNDIERGISRVLQGNYKVEKRFKINTIYEGRTLAPAVNEVVVHTDSIAKIRHYRVYVDDQLMTEVRADGIIVSTPTGSTCYAMSLGAPIIDPSVNALVVVPMAAYKFASRPFVVPADSKITIEGVMDAGCVIVVDGQREYPMKGRSKIDIMRSEQYSKLIRFDTGFYTRVREKLVNTI